jgi:hypothetical protein
MNSIFRTVLTSAVYSAVAVTVSLSVLVAYEYSQGRTQFNKK